MFLKWKVVDNHNGGGWWWDDNSDGMVSRLSVEDG